MKRAITLIMALFLLVTFVSAAEKPTISGSQETAEAGDVVSVTLRLSDNPGLAAWKVELSWDKDALQLDKGSIALSEQFAGGMFVENSNEDGKLYLVWANAENVVASGDLITLNFKVAGKAEAGTYPITVDVSGTRNQNGDKIAVNADDASVTLSGDEEEKDNKDEEKETGDQMEIVNPFTDVSEEAYYFAPTMWAVDQGVTTGMSEDSFAPDMTCNRAQTVTFLWRAAGSPEAHLLRNPFTDVKKDAYYYNAVLWAVENGITTGISDTEFGPDLPVTRGQVVTFLWRTAGASASDGRNPFGDVADDAYYADAVCWAVENGITTGLSDTEFGPDAPCTRSQIVTFLYRYFSQHDNG